ncbi:hypothetical protein LY76DRAFT_423134 [Colletotrichum caudatum]|nr:hypothetical protein LY76DRAFT_423134 [Colletotrichum caudatum]
MPGLETQYKSVWKAAWVNSPKSSPWPMANGRACFVVYSYAGIVLLSKDDEAGAVWRRIGPTFTRSRVRGTTPDRIACACRGSVKACPTRPWKRTGRQPSARGYLPTYNRYCSRIPLHVVCSPSNTPLTTYGTLPTHVKDSETVERWLKRHQDEEKSRQSGII